MLNFWKVNLLSAMEYKTSFVLQVFLMIVNDTVFMFVRYFFFQKFGNIWWTDFYGFLPLLSIEVMAFAFFHVFFGWYKKIPELVMNWWLDSYILRPKNILLTILINWMSISAIGDFFYGIALMMFLPNITIWLWLWMIFLSFFGGMVFLGFLLIFISMAFFIWSSRELFDAVFQSVMWPVHYPPKIFDWTILKYIFMSIIPAYYVWFLPYELALSFSWLKLMILIFAAVFFLSLWSMVFYLWLKKYESGNAINVNL